MKTTNYKNPTKITYLMPKEMAADLCIPFNHMSDEEQAHVLKEMNISNEYFLVYPCTKPECFVVDEEEQENKRKRKELQELRKKQSKEFEQAGKEAEEKGILYADFIRDWIRQKLNNA